MSLIRESEVRAIAKSQTFHFAKSADRIFAELRDIPIATTFNIFLSHSFSDAELILGVKGKLEHMGYSVYVDHQVDTQLNRQHVTRETAEKLRERMIHSESLFYVTSTNSSHSIWMPWELGYFDGIKGKAAILPLNSQDIDTEKFQGQEYLGIYPYVTDTPNKNGLNRLWINVDWDNYISFDDWLKGEKPNYHSI